KLQNRHLPTRCRRRWKGRPRWYLVEAGSSRSNPFAQTCAQRLHPHPLRVQNPEEADESDDGGIEHESHGRVRDLTERRVALGAWMQTLHLSRQHVEQERHRREREQIVLRRDACTLPRLVERGAQ